MVFSCSRSLFAWMKNQRLVVIYWLYATINPGKNNVRRLL